MFLYGVYLHVGVCGMVMIISEFASMKKTQQINN